MTEFDWAYDEESGVAVASMDDGSRHADLIIEDDTHPYVEIWVWTKYQGWDHIETVDLGTTLNMDESKEALEDWFEGSMALW